MEQEFFIHYPTALDWIEHILMIAGAFGWGWWARGWKGER